MGTYKDKNRGTWFALAQYKKSRDNFTQIYPTKQFDKNDYLL